jgi:hypothetical protein
MIWKRTWHDKYTQNKEERGIFLIVIHAGRRRRCTRDEEHKRGATHRMKMDHKA